MARQLKTLNHLRACNNRENHYRDRTALGMKGCPPWRSGHSLLPQSIRQVLLSCRSSISSRQGPLVASIPGKLSPSYPPPCTYGAGNAELPGINSFSQGEALYSCVLLSPLSIKWTGRGPRRNMATCRLTAGHELALRGSSTAIQCRSIFLTHVTLSLLFWTWFLLVCRISWSNLDVQRLRQTDVKRVIFVFLCVNGLIFYFAFLSWTYWWSGSRSHKPMKMLNLSQRSITTVHAKGAVP